MLIKTLSFKLLVILCISIPNYNFFSQELASKIDITKFQIYTERPNSAFSSTYDSFCRISINKTSQKQNFDKLHQTVLSENLNSILKNIESSIEKAELNDALAKLKVLEEYFPQSEDIDKLLNLVMKKIEASIKKAQLNDALAKLKVLEEYFPQSERIDELLNLVMKKIEASIDNARLSDAITELNILKKYFPEFERINELYDKINNISECANINNLYNRRVQAYYIEEDKHNYSVHNGINKQQEFDIYNKADFAKTIINEKETYGTDVFYLDMNEFDSNFASSFINALVIEVQKEYPNLRINMLPELVEHRELLFYGEPIETVDKVHMISTHEHSKRYIFKLDNKKVTADIGIKIDTKFNKRKAKKTKKTFFGFFDINIGTNTPLWDVISNSRKQTNMKLGTTNNDYETWLKKMAKDLDFVYIEIIKVEEIAENE